MSGTQSIKYTVLPLKDIILLEKNPREISEYDFAKLCGDIQKDPNFLEQRPPLINKVKGKLYCYAGTQRVKACTSLGMTDIMCFVEENVPEKVQDERMLKDNLHRGKWDRDKLIQLDFEIMEMQDFGLEDFDFGFNDLEMPTQLTVPLKEEPPSIKIVFRDQKQMFRFEEQLKPILEDFDGSHYSVSQGEI